MPTSATTSATSGAASYDPPPPGVLSSGGYTVPIYTTSPTTTTSPTITWPSTGTTTAKWTIWHEPETATLDTVLSGVDNLYTEYPATTMPPDVDELQRRAVRAAEEIAEDLDFLDDDALAKEAYQECPVRKPRVPKPAFRGVKGGPMPVPSTVKPYTTVSPGTVWTVPPGTTVWGWDTYSSITGATSGVASSGTGYTAGGVTATYPAGSLEAALTTKNWTADYGVPSTWTDTSASLRPSSLKAAE